MHKFKRILIFISSALNHLNRTKKLNPRKAFIPKVYITTARIKYIFCKVNELFSTEDIRDFDQRVYKCPGRSDTFRYFIEILSLLVERLK